MRARSDRRGGVGGLIERNLAAGSDLGPNPTVVGTEAAVPPTAPTETGVAAAEMVVPVVVVVVVVMVVVGEMSCSGLMKVAEPCDRELVC